MKCRAKVRVLPVNGANRSVLTFECAQLPATMEADVVSSDGIFYPRHLNATQQDASHKILNDTLGDRIYPLSFIQIDT